MGKSPPSHNPHRQLTQQRERERKRAFDRTRPNANERGYDSKWQKESAAYLALHNVCVLCGAPSRIVDHIVPHKGDMKLFWRRSNWQALCVSCHSRKTATEDSRFGRRHRVRPRGIGPMPMLVTVICGPPASGKSHYVRERWHEADQVVDVCDYLPMRDDGVRLKHDEPALERALIQRNNRLRELVTSCDVHRLWFVMTGARADDRAWWQAALGAGEIIVLETPVDECILRTAKDPARRRLVETHEALIFQWWRQYSRRPGETIIR